MRDGRRSISWSRLLARGAVSLALIVPGSAPAAPLPIQSSSVPLASLATVQTFNVDLGTLPARPWITILAVPDPGHADMQLSIELSGWQNTPTTPGYTCPGPSNVFLSSSGPGVASLAYSFNGCDPRLGAFAGGTVNVKIRALSFGARGAPAEVGIRIRGETRPPTSTLSDQVVTDFGPQEITLTPTKDTVIYAESTGASNGAGEFLWTGDRVLSLVKNPRRALLAFEIDSLLSPVAVVDAATLSLDVTGVLGGGGTLRAFRVAKSSGGSTWAEGNADPSGSEFVGAASGAPAAANWNYRVGGIVPWSSPGGDVVATILDTLGVDSTGPVELRSAALDDAVQSLISQGGDENGFLLTSFNPALLNAGIQIASRENASGGQPPTLHIAYHQGAIYEEGTVATTVVPFITEGQNFRWIYDLDHDDVLVTNVGGICEVTDTSSPQSLPYTYQFAGTPFVGVDCCTWRIEASSGVVGTGQALFFHQLDATNPANMPPDTDQDGIRNLCDNCVHSPNGPLRGSCLGGPTPRATCRSNAECGAGGACSLSQEDANGDFTGDVCVPEPGVGAGLAAGIGALSAILRRRRRRLRGCPARRARRGGSVGRAGAAAVASAIGALAPVAHAALPLPIDDPAATLSAASPVRSYAVDLATQPTRPVLVVEVQADAGHRDMQLQIEAGNWNAPIANSSACTPLLDEPSLSAPSRGSASLSLDLFRCGPLAIYWNGATVDVAVRALDFGSAGGTATVRVLVRAETRPATGTLVQTVDTSLAPRSTTLVAVKDTVLFEDDPFASNGAGSSLWVGSRAGDIFSPPLERRALLAFDPSNRIPLGSTVSNATLELFVKSAFGVDWVYVERVADGGGSPWVEGDAVAPGDQFYGEYSSVAAATWEGPAYPTTGWFVPGGDLLPGILAEAWVGGPARTSASSYELTAAVQDMVTTGNASNGFALTTDEVSFFDVGAELASREAAGPNVAPTLVVEYTPSGILETGTIATNAVGFIDEGQNFRWIYDLDHDDVLQTNVGGVCEVVDTSSEFQLPYTYRFVGNPAFTGVDCCTWRIDSQTGVVGTGQALFFHHLDSANPANMPPDTDQDGIRNLCDNCAMKPNGPLRGTCLAGSVGATCRSNFECGAGGRCSLSQEDADGNFEGDVCVPEPALAAGLAAGVAALLFAARRPNEAPSAPSSRAPARSRARSA